jgi:hypothetical protein
VQWGLFDTYFRTGKWALEDNEGFRTFLSKTMREELVKYGHAQQEPAAFHIAATLQMAVFAREGMGSNWSPSKYTQQQQKIMATYYEPLLELAGHKDAHKRAKATLALGLLKLTEADLAQAKVFAAKTLALAPRDEAAIDLMAATQEDDDRDAFEKFWLAHAREHPSTRPWLLIALTAFKRKDIDKAERFLLEGEKINPKDKAIMLAKAALALKRGEGSLAKAGTILDAAEKRLREGDEKSGPQLAKHYSGLEACYRYLRAIHTALSGKWEQGRDQLLEIRAQQVLVDDITKALEAFPRPMLVLPAELKVEQKR